MLYTAYYSHHTVHSILYTAYCTPYTVPRTLCHVHCTTYTVPRRYYVVHCTIYPVHCIMYIVSHIVHMDNIQYYKYYVMKWIPIFPGIEYMCVFITVSLYVCMCLSLYVCIYVCRPYVYSVLHMYTRVNMCVSMCICV